MHTRTIVHLLTYMHAHIGKNTQRRVKYIDISLHVHTGVGGHTYVYT